ncbi:MAG: hypothetical protein WD738_17260 [Pirellulales bacterium]
MNAEDETNVTDIELLPDGRICVFGTSLEVLELLDQLQCGADSLVSARLASWRQADDNEPAQFPAIVAEDSHV